MAASAPALCENESSFSLLPNRELLVKCDVQHQNVDARLAEKPQISSIGKLRDQLLCLICGDAPCLCDSCGLCLGISGTDVRVQTRRRGCHGVRWKRRLCREQQGCLVIIEGLDQLYVIEVAVRIFELVKGYRSFIRDIVIYAVMHDAKVD